MEMDGNLWTFQVNLTMDHMGRAVELYFDSVSLEEKRAKPLDWVRARRSALSSIIHAYCGLESAINAIGYELFFNPDSNIYVPSERRDFPLTRMIDTWHGRMQSVDKLQFILSHGAKEEISPLLTAEVLEINNLRNWIVHGFSFKRTVLVEPKEEEEGVFTEVDREDTVRWEEKFPRLKFNPLDRLAPDDARKVLSVVLRSLKVLSANFENRMFIIPVYFGSARHFVISPASDDIDKILNVVLH